MTVAGLATLTGQTQGLSNFGWVLVRLKRTFGLVAPLPYWVGMDGWPSRDRDTAKPACLTAQPAHTNHKPLPNKQLQQPELNIRTVSVPHDPIVTVLQTLVTLTPDQRAALAALLSATAPTGAAPAPTLSAPQPAPRPAPTLPDDVLPWERPKTQESH